MLRGIRHVRVKYRNEWKTEAAISYKLNKKLRPIVSDATQRGSDRASRGSAEDGKSSVPTVTLTFAKSDPHLPLIASAEGRYESASG